MVECIWERTLLAVEGGLVRKNQPGNLRRARRWRRSVRRLKNRGPLGKGKRKAAEVGVRVKGGEGPVPEKKGGGRLAWFLSRKRKEWGGKDG